MRLLRITTHYPTYLSQFYTKNPDLKDKSFSIQHQKLIEDCFGWSDFWTHLMKPLGYQGADYIANGEALQKAWAKENNIKFREKNWFEDILTTQVKDFSPDILFVDDYVSFTNKFITYLREECPSIKLILGWCGAPYQDSSIFNSYDIILSNIPEFVKGFREQGHKSEYIKHAFEPRILSKINTDSPKTVDFSFLGSIVKGQSYHLEREKLIKQLVQKTNLQIWSDLSSSRNKIKQLPFHQILYDISQLGHLFPTVSPLISKIPKIRHYFKLQQRPSLDDYINPIIISNSHLPVYGISMFQQLSNSKVTFNNHINVSSESASNMRLFEATGVGTCLLTDWKENLSELFEIDREVVTYKSVDECIEKAKWLLEHPQERELIAKAGQARTLKDHTFAQRAIQLDEIIRKVL